MPTGAICSQRGNPGRYGREGPDYQLPGYDIGAFWAMSGCAGMIQGGGSYSTYALAYGDTTTGASLLGGLTAVPQCAKNSTVGSETGSTGRHWCSG